MSDPISEGGTPLTVMEDWPTYATSDVGRVYAFGHPKRGAVWYRLKHTADIAIDRSTPGHVVIRHTGRFYFGLFHGGRFKKHFWVPPQEELPPPPRPASDPDDDDCPF